MSLYFSHGTYDGNDMLKRICLFVCLIFLTGLSYATNQIKDQITLFDSDGRMMFKSYLEESPLGQFLSDKGIRPEMTCTANYSGYTADWIIRDGKLYLENYYAEYKSLDKKEIEAHSKIKKLFPRAKGPVLAEWYTGTLHFGSGKIRQRIHLGHLALFDYLHVYSIRNGIIESQKTYKYPESVDYYKKRDQETTARVQKMIAGEK